MQMIELEITKGNFTDGFDVRLEIRDGSDRVSSRIDGTLPANSGMCGLYQLWRYQYEALVTNRLGLAQNIAHGGDILSCQDRFQAWIEAVNQWLQSYEMLKLDRALSSAFAVQPNSTQFNIKLDTPKSSTDDWALLWKLPWYSWEILQTYPQIEPILTPATAVPIAHPVSRRKQGRILAITGGNKSLNTAGSEERIDLKGSIDELKKLHTFELVYLDQPSEQEFCATLNDANGWDILFFTGHSGMDNAGGWFALNSTTKIRSKPFQLSLQTACQNGLQLAVFSSCDGVQLAQDLSAFNVPSIIAMREIIPNTVAQQFIRGLVQTIVTSVSESCHLAIAVRTARATLEGCTHYPGATNLPMIFQRSPQPLPVLQDLCPKFSERLSERLSKRQALWRSLPILFAISLFVSGLIIGVQTLGWLQASELSAYNRLMLNRPIEAPDPRLLIVGADESDLQEYGDGNTIPDGVFAEAIRILDQYQPRAIGLDNYRDNPYSPGRADLIQEINNNTKIITVCFFSGHNIDNSIAPPDADRKDPFSGFVDLYNDNDINPSDPALRRYLLSKGSNVNGKISKCKTDYSFAILLIDKYLDQEVRQNDDNYWSFNGVIAPHLNSNSGGYTNLNDKGYQVLINYRNTINPRRISHQINFRSVFNQSFREEWIKDRVVIIGIVADSKHDEHHTPYGNISGPAIHAHVVSQFLSAIDDDRPLLSWWPEWLEYIWLIAWASITAVIIFVYKNPVHKSISIVLEIIIVWGVSQILFSSLGLWVPPISPILTIILTGFCVSNFVYYRKNK